MAKAKSPEAEKFNPYTPNFWYAMKEVMVASLSKGQFLIAVIGFIIIIAVLKMPGSDITKLLMETISVFKSFYMYGWLITFITVPTSVILSSRARKLHQKEKEQIYRELSSNI